MLINVKSFIHTFQNALMIMLRTFILKKKITRKKKLCTVHVNVVVHRCQLKAAIELCLGKLFE